MSRLTQRRVDEMIAAAVERAFTPVGAGPPVQPDTRADCATDGTCNGGGAAPAAATSTAPSAPTSAVPTAVVRLRGVPINATPLKGILNPRRMWERPDITHRRHH